MNFNSKNYTIYLIITVLLIVLVKYILVYFSINNYESNRIYNLRLIPEEYRSSLLKKFLIERYKKNSIWILGDSQPYGFKYPTKFIFSTILENKINRNIINTAFQDASIRDNIFILNYAYSKGLKFDFIIFNANQSHVQYPKHTKLFNEGLMDYKIGILTKNNVFEKFTQNFSPTSTYQGDKFNSSSGIDNYFDMKEIDLITYFNNLKKLIIIARKIAKHVIIYDTPHPVSEIKRLSLNTNNLVKFSVMTKKLSLEYDVIYLKPDIILNDYYKDIVHFNSKGHEMMSNMLFNEILDKINY